MPFSFPPSECPSCGKIWDSIAVLSGTEAPKKGDLTLCFSCAELLCFAEGMTLRRANSDDLEGHDLEYLFLARKRIIEFKNSQDEENE